MHSTRAIKDDSSVVLAFWEDVEVFFHWLTLVFFLQTPPHPGVSSLAELYWPQTASVLPTLCLHGEPRMLSEAHPTQDRECRWLPHRSRLGGKVIMLRAPPEEPKDKLQGSLLATRDTAVKRLRLCKCCIDESGWQNQVVLQYQEF